MKDSAEWRFKRRKKTEIEEEKEIGFIMRFVGQQQLLNIVGSIAVS